MNILSGLDISADFLIFGITEEAKSESEDAVRDFIKFLQRRSAKDIAEYYDVVRFLSKYIDTEGQVAII